MSPAETKSEPVEDVEFGDNIDMATFEQILEMDEPGDSEFSHSIVFGFFDQVDETFVEIEQALRTSTDYCLSHAFNREDEDLEKLSSLGHFLKGSSATLGLVKIRDGCEAIQRYGKNENLDGSELKDDEKCLKLIRECFAVVKTDYKEVEKLLKQYYDQKE
ncbi:osomolarity two-component phosphorelay intermediate ypd1 [Fusarium longipes]|uniref:Osomolarity two-component phosphorelay intermediate ypd1 n=1 Tax=Fusarium longipes TaxID=694270 RepID=A0A395SU64_9HYPO|nr:osomolarity two-component phosphorelay intermediate ypd1 [Fusarium longipes]